MAAGDQGGAGEGADQDTEVSRPPSHERSVAVSAGVPLPVIQKRLGHKSIQITVDVYGGCFFGSGITVPIMGLNIADAWKRADWAQGDMETLNGLVKTWIEEKPYVTWFHEQDDRWYATFRRLAPEERERELLDKHARLVGSVLDHLRAALNYLAFQLAMLGLSEDPSLQGKVNPESVEFPIFMDPDLYRKKNRIKALPKKFESRIEAVQPYHSGEHAHGLWMLHELSRVHRHRLIHPTAMTSYVPGQGFHLDFPETMADVEVLYKGGELNHGDDLYSFVALPDHAHEMNPQPVLGVGLLDPVCDGLPEVHVMNKINKAAGAVLTGWLDLIDICPL